MSRRAYRDRCALSGLAALPGVAVAIARKSPRLHTDEPAYALHIGLVEEIPMKKILTFAFVSMLATACSKKTPSCEELYEHTKEIAPPEMRDGMEKQKDRAIEKCSKMSDEAKRCAADAKSMEDLQKCPRS